MNVFSYAWKNITIIFITSHFIAIIHFLDLIQTSHDWPACSLYEINNTHSLSYSVQKSFSHL